MIAAVGWWDNVPKNARGALKVDGNFYRDVNVKRRVWKVQGEEQF